MKKWFLRIGLGLLLLVGLTYGYLMVRSKMSATVHDQKLQLTRASLPQGSNAFYLLQKAGTQVWWPEHRDDAILDLAADTNWNETLASTILASNREALAGWDAAAKVSALQVPEAASADDWEPYLRDWRNLAKLAVIRQNDLLHHGKASEAYAQMGEQLALGRRMQNAQGVLIVYLVGAAVNHLALSQMRHWVAKADLSAGQIKDCLHELKPDPDAAAAAYANTIKAEYQNQVKIVDALKNGTMTNWMSGGYYPRISSWWPVFNASQTKALCAQGMLKLVQVAAEPYSEAKAAVKASPPGLFSMYFSGNGVGQVLYYMAMPAVAGTLEQKARGGVELQATRTILALRACQLTHGKLPATLSALVPEFLPTVPIDDFDGKPLRYSLKHNCVYSVGQNLKDDGGDAHDVKVGTSHRPLDLVYPFTF